MDDLNARDVGFDESYDLSANHYPQKTYRRSNKIEVEENKTIRYNLVEIADKIRSEHKIIYCANHFYEDREGCYRQITEEAINKWIMDVLKEKFSRNRAGEIIYALKTKTYVKTEELNNTSLLNLKNGLFNIDTYELMTHDPSVYSTIQLEVNYNPQANCSKWINTIYEIFEGDEEKIEALQEFFGLCLTKETKYEKAFICVGEGSNGKSVALNTLAHILGRQNYSAVPLERFNNAHYIANLFGKLANVSIETNAKSEVYDSTFKAIVSGDPIEADRKYGTPFTFKPCCKLIFAVNNLPRVDDKTNAFFRRLVILKFKRKFEEKEQNKNLKNELYKEKDGIFLWCLEGLRRLRERGYFKIGKSTRKEIDAYRRENNNVIVFIEDECQLDKGLLITKQELYDTYVEWCKNNGNKSLSKLKFGKELIKQFSSVEDDRTSGSRVWIGIGIK